MSASTTLDTNILVYAFDDRDPFKQSVCFDIVAVGLAAHQPLAFQAAGEF